MVDCTFQGATLRKLRSEPNTVFERCDFDEADLFGADFAHTTFIECAFQGAVFSAATSFRHCRFVGSDVDFGPARVATSTSEGLPLPDRWDGQDETLAAEERYLARFLAAAEAGDEDAVPLEPEYEDWSSSSRPDK